jgi:competence protein ComEA
MRRIFVFLMATVASIGLAFAASPTNAPLAGEKLAQKDTATAKDAKKADAKKADAPKDTKAEAKKAEPMDINSASEKDLATLPGIGEARAKAIVKGRPYKGKDELLAKKIVPANVYKDIQGKIIAKQK